MKKIFAILIIIFTMLSVCSCRTEEKKYMRIYGYPSYDTTNVVKAKCIDCDGRNSYRFELIDNIIGAGIEQEFVAYGVGRRDKLDVITEVFYGRGTPICPPEYSPPFANGEIYILYLTPNKDSYIVNCICLDSISG